MERTEVWAWEVKEEKKKTEEEEVCIRHVYTPCEKLLWRVAQDYTMKKRRYAVHTSIQNRPVLFYFKFEGEKKQEVTPHKSARAMSTQKRFVLIKQTILNI